MRVGNYREHGSKYLLSEQDIALGNLIPVEVTIGLENVWILSVIQTEWNLACRYMDNQRSDIVVAFIKLSPVDFFYLVSLTFKPVGEIQGLVDLGFKSGDEIFTR